MRLKLTLPIEECDYWIRFMKMPPKIYAFVHPNSDGTYIIFLDPRRSRDQMIEDYIHELWHIIRGDLHNDVPIWKVERIA